MKLASWEFACFAGLLLLLYYRIPAKQQWKLLLAASTLFYLRGGWRSMAFLLVTSGSAYLAIQKMEKNKASFDKQTARQKNRRLLALCLTGNLGLLMLWKARLLTGPYLLPLGISFYTFQTMGYVTDVCRGTAKGEDNFFRFHLFVSYFPLLTQGPICRQGQLAPQLFAEHSYDRQTVSFGLQRMLWGYFKKLVIGDRLASVVAVLRETEGSSGAFFLLTLLYAIRIYADFTGGIDVVLGLSQSLDIELPENFQLPFSAKSVAEYWRRWHITLGEWMKQYVFYPISVSRPMLKLSRVAGEKWGKRGRRLPVYIATTLTWAATGLWHGLTPNFLLWGMLNCGAILLSEELPARLHLPQGKSWDRLRMLRTFLLMNLIRAWDLFPNPLDYLRAIGSPWNLSAISGTLPLTGADLGVLVLGILLMAGVSHFQSRGGSVRRWLWRKNSLLRQGLLFGLFLLILLLGRYGVGYEASDFIYNQF